MSRMKSAATRREESRAKNYQAKSTNANGLWRVTIATGWGPVLDAVDDLAFAQTRWKPALERVADALEDSAKKAFRTGVGPDGYRWAGLQEYYSTQKTRKGFSRAMLVKDGKLRSAAMKRNAMVKLTNTKMKYEVDSPYATTHQFGSQRNLSKGKRGGFRGSRVRNFMVWGDDFKQLFSDTLNQYGRERREEILKGLDRNGG